MHGHGHSGEGATERGPISRQFSGLLAQSSAFMSAFNISQVCLTWFVFTYTGSAITVGEVAIVETVAVLIISLPAGTFVDRVNKGGLLLVSGLIGTIVMAVLSIMSGGQDFNLYIILALSALWGISREISRSANLSALPDLSGKQDLSRANGIYRALVSSIGSVSNAVAGGVIIALGVAVGFALSSVEYLLSAVLAGVIILPFLGKTRERIEGGEEGRSMLSDLKEGFVWLVRRRGFFLLTVSASFFNFFMDMVVTFYVIYVVTGTHSGSLVYGVVLAALAAGDVTGSIVAGRLRLLKYSGKINVVLFGGVTGLSVLVMGLFPTQVNAILFTFIFGISLGISINVWLTSAHNIVPGNMTGRYFALDGVLSSVTPVSIAVGALLISRYGILDEFIISGSLLIAFTILFSFMKSLWRLDGTADRELPPVTPPGGIA